jgi:hypothetical protein
MSEHIAALALAAAKRLFIEHDNLKRADFNQRSSTNKMPPREFFGHHLE